MCAFRNNGIIIGMETIIERIDKDNIDEEVIELAGRILKDGGLVAFPTETVYGLGANAMDEDAARKTYEAKGRPSDNPLIVHIAELSALKELISDTPEYTYALAQRFWPGPLTLIFNKSEKVPYGTTGGLETVAVRMPAHEIAKEIILAGGGYISAPSANTSGRPSPTQASHVAEDLCGKIDMIIDGGSVEIGVESTILDMTVQPPMILRPGAITKSMLEEVVGEVAVDQTLLRADSSEAPKAPGMKYRHYAPKAQLIIIDGELSEEVKAIKQIAYEQTRLGYKVGIIASDETLDEYTVGNIKSIGTREDELTISRNLYAILREFDEDGVEYIYSEAFVSPTLGQAIMNRLLKAAGHHVIPASEITKLQEFRRIIFVSGSDNTRAPMAAEILRNQPLLQEYKIESRGMVVLFPEPANQKAEAIMKSQQMTLSGHEAVAFSDADLDEDTLVLTLQEQQKWKIVADYRNVKYVYTLAEYVGEEAEISAAIGQPLTEYGKIYETIKMLVEKLAKQLNEEAKNAKA